MLPLLDLPLSGAATCSAACRALSTTSTARACSSRSACNVSGLWAKAVAPGPQTAACQAARSSRSSRRCARLLARQAARTACSWLPRRSRTAATSATAAARAASCSSTAREAPAARPRTLWRLAATLACSEATWNCCVSSSVTFARLLYRRFSRRLSAPQDASAAVSSSLTSRSCSSSSSRRARTASTFAVASARSAFTVWSSISMALVLSAIWSWMPRASSAAADVRLSSDSARSSASMRKAWSVLAAPQRGGAFAWHEPAATAPAALRSPSSWRQSERSSLKRRSCALAASSRRERPLPAGPGARATL
mmetsp:Transcript_89579/g.278232  ORF Transcript_89579/g.278232 Transcript_89579/m.278232 type:complete len:310 (+) Transcript_89579:201-1130(+)